MSDYEIEWTEKNYGKALRQRAAALDALAAETRKLKAATARMEVAETALADVWRWTHNGHPELDLLLPILRKADTNAALLCALDELEVPA